MKKKIIICFLAIFIISFATLIFKGREQNLTNVKDFINIGEIENAGITSTIYLSEKDSYTYLLSEEEVEQLKEILKGVRVKKVTILNENNKETASLHLIIGTKYKNTVIDITDTGKMKLGYRENYWMGNNALQNYLVRLVMENKE